MGRRGTEYGRKVALAPSESERTCRVCGETKPLALPYFERDGISPKTGRWRFRRICTACKKAAKAAMSEEDRARQRKVWAAKARHKFATDPEARKRKNEINRRWREKRKRLNPKRYHEDARMWARLQREAQGRALRGPVKPVVDQEMPRLPVGPLVDVMVERLRRMEQTEKFAEPGDHTNGYIADLCALADVHVRTFLRWRTDRGEVQFDVADRALIGLDLLWFDVWDESNTSPEEFARVRWAFEGEEAA